MKEPMYLLKFLKDESSFLPKTQVTLTLDWINSREEVTGRENYPIVKGRGFNSSDPNKLSGISK